MGDEADRVYMQELDHLVLHDLMEMGFVLEDTSVWTMRDGTQIKFTDMSDRHLENSIRMMERSNKTDYWQYDALCNEKKRRTKSHVRKSNRTKFAKV